MYEFDEERWDEQGPEAGDVKGISDDWLIQSIPSEEFRMVDPEATYLQIGTGQWCSAEYATRFSLLSAAIFYARVFGYVEGDTVRIVKHRF